MSSSPPASAPLLSLPRTLRLNIDQSTWPISPAIASTNFPSEFQALGTTTQIDFMDAMRWVGYFSIPRGVPNWADATRWAQVKYVSALDSGNDLRLNPSMDEVDPHPKGILSDDWGAGLSVSWLQQVFGYRYIGHGRRILRWLERRLRGAFKQRPTKIGPPKCPDFCALLPGGRYHLIECKGTTTNQSTLAGQLRDAVDQKTNFDWTSGPNRIDQRLATGIYIADANAKTTSLLSIRDPESAKVSEAIDELTDDDISLPLRWDMLLGGLIACGFYQLAYGLMDVELDYEGHKNVRSVQSIQDIKPQFSVERDGWVGTERETTLAVPVNYTDRTYSRVISRSIVQRELISSLPRALQSPMDIEHAVDEVTREYRLDLARHPLSLAKSDAIGSGPDVLTFGGQFRFELFLA